MPRTPRAFSTACCGRFMAFWRLSQGLQPREQAPEGAARGGERGARFRTALLLLSSERYPRHFLVVAVGVWGGWDARMAPKLNRTPRSLRARQNQDPGGTRKDKKLLGPGSKEHSSLYVKGGLQKTTDMEKDVRNSVPTMFTSMMRIKQISTEKAARDPQSSVPGADGGQPQSRDSDLEEEIPLTDSDIESSSAASIWVSNYSTCRRKSAGQIDVRGISGAKPRRDPLMPREEDEKRLACNTLVPPSTGGPVEPPSLDLIYRTMVQNHEQAQRESRKMKAANRQLQLSIKKVGKSCQDIGVRIATMETRTEELETEVRAATVQTMTQGQQISDIQWKLEDAENRQRRNNLRILGIAEDLEGQDTRAFIVSLFKKASPDLIGWDWEKEIQRAHRFPLMRKKKH
ncbi:hypothetical protein NDU88_002102 [Pleurodeles waltl]|uniref:Uncharacterized protein n=1 Tax=Pleurodeles waltl TaxID=8319 RepID=A0AAV7SBZ6_PLEWA|nr:hypothetical protein NDU88_002102 [Pleurodeles waltl]